jgi:glutathione S-transferase
MERYLVKLYLSPGACSLADHIALHEAGFTFDRVRVDLKSHTTEDGRDFARVNPKGYVPALELDDGNLLTENIAILTWITDNAPALSPGGGFERYRLLETLAFFSTELHKGFAPFVKPGADAAAKAKAGETIAARLDLIDGQVEGPWLFGQHFTVADCYLFVMLTWAQKNKVRIPAGLKAWFDRVKARPAVQLALKHEGLTETV